MAQNTENDEQHLLEEFRRTKIDHIESETDRKICEAYFLSAKKVVDSTKANSDEDEDLSIEDAYKVVSEEHCRDSQADKLIIRVEIFSKYMETTVDTKKTLYALVIEHLTKRFCVNLVKAQSKIGYVLKSSTNRVFVTDTKKYDQWASPILLTNLFGGTHNCESDLTGKFVLEILVIHDIKAFEKFLRAQMIAAGLKP